jgi:transcription antitermination factor NusG
MVRDIPGQGDEEAALEWGVDFNLAEGEELPEDHEELTEAQFTVFQMVQILKGTFQDAEVGEIRGEKGSGLVLPTG